MAPARGARGAGGGPAVRLPGALVVLALAAIYAAFGQAPLVEALFYGVKAAVLVIVIEALLKISKRALKKPAHWALAALAFVAIFFFAAPFPLIVLLAGVYGFFTAPRDETPAAASLQGVSTSETLRTAAVWLAIWILPLGAVAATTGIGSTLSQIGLFFSQLAVVTFGGAYAVLAYMQQEVVTGYGWLTAGEMLDGLGLAETTPGPLILVTEFVAFLAGYSHGAEGGVSWTMGLAAAVIALWATFAPCFLWIFVGAPYIEWISAQPRLQGALSGIIAAVVGVMLNLALWFGLHVFFGDVSLEHVGFVQLWTPTLSSLDWGVVALAAVSAVLLLWARWPLLGVLGVAAAASLASAFAFAPGGLGI